MIDSAINLFGSSVFLKKSSKDSLSSNPKNFCGHSALKSSSTFTRTSVSAESNSLQMFSSTGSRMNFLLSLHDKTVLNELTDKDSGVSLTDLLDFTGIHPNSLLSAL